MAEALIEPAPLSPPPVRVPGHKHTAVPIIAASVAVPGPVHVSNVPRIADTRVLAAILEQAGAHVAWSGSDLEIDARNVSNTDIPRDLAAAIHGSLYLLPVILGRFGHVSIGRTGGCRIGADIDGGARPVSHILSVIGRFGGRFETPDGAITGSTAGFVPVQIDIMDYSDREDLLNGPLVSGATKNALLAAFCATPGHSIIHNPYPKPDAMELARFLDGRGAQVDRMPAEIRVTGASDFALPNPFSLLSDLSETMTWIVLAVLHGAELKLELVEADRVVAGLAAEIALLEAMGVRYVRRGACLWIAPPSRLRSVDIDVTSTGIYSDHQPLFALLLLRGDRPATIRDRVWTERFAYAKDLAKLGARIEREPGQIQIFPSVLRAEEGVVLEAGDLRAAAALLVAATGLDRPVRLRGIEHLERGYEDFPRSLRSWGARIRV